jgi:hypothetical protein
MVKKSASFVLASLKPSTYAKLCASGFRSLRPRWTAFLTILRDSWLAKLSSASALHDIRFTLNGFL